MGSLSIGSFNIGSFAVSLGANYLLGRALAKDGPRLGNLNPGGGEYGVGMPRLYGEKVRMTGLFIAMDDIKETRHTVEDYSEIVGAVTGAVQGFMIGGPVGAAIGGVVGGLLGAATPDQHYYTYSDTFALLLADRTGQDPIEMLDKVFAAGKTLFRPTESGIEAQALDGSGRIIWRKWRKNRYFKSLELFTGHPDQTPSIVLASNLGEESSYPFTAYIVIEDLQLAEFANAVPPCDLLVRVETGATFAGAAEDICGRAGIDPVRDLSTTALADKTLLGYIVAGETTCWDALKPLLPVFGRDAGEVAGQIRFSKRADTLRSTISRDDMGAYVYGDSPPDVLTFRRETDLKLPQETSLTFVDPARDYQANTASTPPRTEGDASSNVSVDIPLVLTADEGATAAALMHWDAWLGRTQLNFNLTDAWIGLEVGRAYAIPFAGEHLPYRVVRRTRGANGIIEVEAWSDESVTYTASVTGDSGTLPDDVSTLFPETRLAIMDMPILEDAHDDYGFYVVMAGGDPYWTRGKVQASSDGATYATLIDRPFTCPAMGDVTGTLAAGTTDGLDDTLDTTSVLTVVLLHDGMTLESCTDAQLDAWKNFAFVGANGQGEYLQFKTATKVAARTWELTDLRRGRRGTDWAIGTHGAGEEFALLGDSGVFRIVYSDDASWGDPLSLRGVTLHQDEDDATVQVFANSGEGKRPYSPVAVEGSWDGSNDVTISWTARSRLDAGGLGIDDRDEYDIELFGTPGATRTVAAAETTIFTAAEQTSAGITPGDSISGRVRQASDVNDGRWRNFTLLGPNAALLMEDGTTYLELEDGSDFELG